VEFYNILIVEDEVIIAETLQEMLIQLGYSSIQRCKTQKEAERIIEEENLDLAILDINLHGGHEGIELGKRCNQKDIPYFFLTSYSDRMTILEAKKAKPGNYVIKPFSPEEIMVAVELTLMHQTVKAPFVENMRSISNFLSLSEREIQVMNCLYRKLSNSEMSAELDVSPNTVKFHLKNLYNKLEINSRSELENKLREISTELKR
jgi:DNA-binding NarL/FixJ family response regulator